MDNYPVWSPLIALLRSRKFWVGLITAIVMAVAFFQGAITAEQLADALVILAGVIIAAIAGEDMAEKARKP